MTEPDAGPVATTLLYEALRSLSAEHRSAIVQAYYVEASPEEAPSAGRMSDSEAKARLHDALRALHGVALDSGILS